MLGAIAGDIIGSAYEYTRRKDYDFQLLSEKSHFTDDTVMTLAVAQWLMESESFSSNELIDYMQKLGRKYPDVGYGPVLRIGYQKIIHYLIIVMVMAQLCV